MFDRVVVVDWSASARPKRGRDSVWIAVTRRGDDDVVTSNPSTRTAACDEIEMLCRRPGRTLLGVDFSLGYPGGTAAALGLSGSPWRSMWDLLTELVVDRDDNANNRFEVAAELNARIGGGPGPFWGCPPSRRTPTLTSTKVRPDPLAEWRHVEAVLRRRGDRPFSAWQLLGTGSVGSQSLVGIARLARLERSLVAAGHSVDVWPFTGGSGAESQPGADVVIAEVWPSMDPLEPLAGRVRDEAQVIGTARRLAAGVTFVLPAPPGASARSQVLSEEGWVLGA